MMMTKYHRWCVNRCNIGHTKSQSRTFEKRERNLGSLLDSIPRRWEDNRRRRSERGAWPVVNANPNTKEFVDSEKKKTQRNEAAFVCLHGAQFGFPPKKNL